MLYPFELRARFVADAGDDAAWTILHAGYSGGAEVRSGYGVSG